MDWLVQFRSGYVWLNKVTSDYVRVVQVMSG
jgi:hypothetical protein